MRRAISWIVGSAGIAAVASAVALSVQLAPAHATSYTIKVNISAAQALADGSANPGATGSGSGIVTYNSVTKVLSWNITFSGTQGTVNLAHFHGPAAPGTPAGVQVLIPGPYVSPLIGSSAPLTATQESQLLAGLWYINIHTTHSPAGEIRGQVVSPTGATIGGVAELPDQGATPLQANDSSGPSSGVLAAIIAGGVLVAVASVGAVWYGRKRWSN